MRPAESNNDGEHPADPVVLDHERGAFAGDGHKPQRRLRHSVARSEARGPPVPKLGFTVVEFAQAVGISVAHYYKLRSLGLGPRSAKLGTRVVISYDEAQRWLAERTAASEGTTTTE